MNNIVGDKYYPLPNERYETQMVRFYLKRGFTADHIQRILREEFGCSLAEIEATITYVKRHPHDQ